MAKSHIALIVNGKPVEALVEPRTLLIHFLREDLNLTGPHIGCETSHCGACTVDLDGKSVKSCTVFAVQTNGAVIRTIEGMANADGTLHALQEGFREMHGLQCGFCTPGMILRAYRLLQENPRPSEEEIRYGISGNLCRCTGYRGIVRAILSVLELRRAGNDASAVDTQAPPVAAFTPFTVAAAATTVAAPAPAAVVAAPAPAGAGAKPAAPKPAAAQKKPGTVIEDEFSVDHPLATVWEIFADMPAVAACLPGAEISEHTPTSLKGKISTKFGPMRAAFNGTAALERDEDAKRGAIRGNGTDSLSGSRARGDITYQLFDAGGGRTRVAVAIDYSLQGPLAQFSRGGLVKEFVKKMVADFAANLNARLGAPAGAEPAVATEMKIEAGSVFWSWLVSSIKKLFGGKP